MYEIWVTDGISVEKLDCDDIDMSINFNVADIKDISTRKDTLTKQITLKGTKQNNKVFGQLFHGNRIADTSIANKMFFNYSPSRTLGCIIYEDGIELMRGNLRILHINIKNGFVNYQAIISGSFIELKSLIVDKYLSDLSFENLKHKYKWDNIKNSWNTSIEIFNPATSSFSTQTFTKGSGYVYPYIDYGKQFLIQDSDVTNTDVTKFHAINFRPAVYVREYMNRIFSQAILPGWSYEVKGSPSFIEKFNSLIVPNAAENLRYTFSGFNLHFQQPLVVIDTQVGRDITAKTQAKLLYLNQYTSPPSNTIAPYIKNVSGSSKILYVDRSVTADATFFVQMADIDNPYNKDMHFHVQLVQRPVSNSTSQLNGWDVIAESEFTVGANSSLASKTINVAIGERKWEENTNLALRIFVEHDLILFTDAEDVVWKVLGTSLDVPKDALTQFTADINLGDGTDVDIIAPAAPDNVKQLDFIKSIMTVMNMYAYTEQDDPKRLIFAKYDDFYALTDDIIINTTALNWTNKVDVANADLHSNVDLPKSYLFAYKDDNDRLNAEYKKKYGVTWGTLSFTDAFGIVDQKKVEVIFSPTPIGELVGTRRKHPMLYTQDGVIKKPLKTNIRLLYYNGVKSCVAYDVCKDEYSSGWTVSVVDTISVYPQTSSYYYDNAGLAIEDLNFGKPKEYFIAASNDYQTSYTAYELYYSNQIAELTNPNICIYDMNVLLTEVDISNLDLKIPVFIDMGEFGYMYFKILSVEYKDNTTPSKVVLQKIFIGSER